MGVPMGRWVRLEEMESIFILPAPIMRTRCSSPTPPLIVSAARTGRIFGWPGQVTRCEATTSAGNRGQPVHRRLQQADKPTHRWDQPRHGRAMTIVLACWTAHSRGSCGWSIGSGSTGLVNSDLLLHDGLNAIGLAGKAAASRANVGSVQIASFGRTQPCSGGCPASARLPPAAQPRASSAC